MFLRPASGFAGTCKRRKTNGRDRCRRSGASRRDGSLTAGLRQIGQRPVVAVIVVMASRIEVFGTIQARKGSGVDEHRPGRAAPLARQLGQAQR